MPQTLPNGITTPINADAYNLSADLATMGGSANVIITVANQAARDALIPYAGMTVYRNDLTGNVLETYDGTRWLSTAQNTYTPTLAASTTNPNLGTGVPQGVYSVIGKTIVGQFFVPFGTGGSIGSGAYQIGLPNAFTYAPLASYIPVGQWLGFGGGANNISGYCRQGGAANNYLNLYQQTTVTSVGVVGSGTYAWSSGMFMAGTFSAILA